MSYDYIAGVHRFTRTSTATDKLGCGHNCKSSRTVYHDSRLGKAFTYLRTLKSSHSVVSSWWVSTLHLNWSQVCCDWAPMCHSATDIHLLVPGPGAGSDVPLLASPDSAQLPLRKPLAPAQTQSLSHTDTEFPFNFNSYKYTRHNGGCGTNKISVIRSPWIIYF